MNAAPGIKQLRVLDLFSGIGGFSLGLERAGMRTVAFCEIEEYPRQVLKKHWPDVPIFNDIRNLKGDEIGSVDVICGGFPCQPFSSAGKQRGKKDDRHLWPEMFRLIKEVRPTWVIGENVAGFITMALDDMLDELEGEGYETQTFVIPACAVGAVHRRNRVWILAHTKSLRPQQAWKGVRSSKKRLTWRSHTQATLATNAELHGQHSAPFKRRLSKNASEASTRKGSPKLLKRVRATTPVANSNGFRLQREPIEQSNESFGKKPNDKQLTRCRSARQFRPIQIPSVSAVRRKDDGLPNRVARLKALGNAVVPQIPEMIGRAILKAEK